jgi:hypothetical protein
MMPQALEEPSRSDAPKVLDYPSPRHVPAPSRPLWVVVIVATAITWWLMAAFRIISIPLLILSVLAFVLYPHHKRKRWLATIALLSLGSTFLPFDIDVANFYGPARGSGPSYPHFVRYVKGMPRDKVLLQKYGQYIPGGCMNTGFEPKWVLMWK